MSDDIVNRRVGEPPAAFVKALQRLLRPLVRIMIAQGVTYPYLTRLLKPVFVEVAEQEFPLDGKPQTDSRLSLLTGVHRKDVKQFRGGGPEVHEPPSLVSLNGQMITLWMGSDRFRDAEGNPKPLVSHGENENEASFEELVRTVSKDIRSRAVLDEWLRLELAQIDESGHINLNVDAFIPADDFDDLAYYFGRNLHDHIAAGAHNLSGNTPALLERSVYYDKLTPATVASLREMAHKIAMDGHITINEEALRLANEDEGKSDASQRMNFGSYFYTGVDDSEPEEGDER